MLRLFTGIRLPPSLCQHLHRLHGGIEGARWTHIDDYHVTLSFIGNVDEATAEDIDEALADIRVPSFNLTLKGTGIFSKGDNAGYLWMGVEHNEALHRLKEKVDRALESRHLPVDKRKYTPHVTMARLKNSDNAKIAEFMQAHNLFASAPFAVDEFILYQSHNGKEGARYEELATYPLTLL